MDALALPIQSSNSAPLPLNFVRRLAQIFLGQLQEDASAGKRNAITAQLSELLADPEFAGAVPSEVAGILVEELVGYAPQPKGERMPLTFDALTGALCWSALEVARVMGIDKRTLIVWRRFGAGPSFIKVGPAKQHPVVYPVVAVLSFLAERAQMTEETKKPKPSPATARMVEQVVSAF